MDSSRRRYGQGLFLLLHRIIQAANDGVGIPPATISVIALQTAIYLRFIPVPWKTPSDVCLSLDLVWYQGNWRRFVCGALEHIDDMHLYYNMASFLVKGRTLERRFGTFKFMFTLIVFTILSDTMYLFLNYQAYLLFGSDEYKYRCAVGFSGVIFALKVLTTHYSHSEHSSQWLVWSELLLIQLIAPNASFIGHLAGILIGLAYVSGPLKALIDFPFNLMQTRNNRSPGRSRTPSEHDHRGHGPIRSRTPSEHGHRGQGPIRSRTPSEHDNRGHCPIRSQTPSEYDHSGHGPIRSRTPSEHGHNVYRPIRSRTPSEHDHRGQGPIRSRTPSEHDNRGHGPIRSQTPSVYDHRGHGPIRSQTPSEHDHRGHGSIRSRTPNEHDHRGHGPIRSRTPSEHDHRGHCPIRSRTPSEHDHRGHCSIRSQTPSEHDHRGHGPIRSRSPSEHDHRGHGPITSRTPSEHEHR